MQRRYAYGNLTCWLRRRLWILVLFPFFTIAQEVEKRGSDPLQGRVRTDSTEVDSLLKASEALRFKSPDSSITFAQRAITLSDDISYEVGKALGFKNIGLVYGDRNNFTEALDFFNRSLIIYEKVKDTAGISSIQNNIGAVYQTTGNDPKALEYFLQSLKNGQVVQDSLRIGTAYVNIGTVYSNDELTYDQAIENYRRSIPYFEGIDYALGLAVANVNIGELYLLNEQPEPSLPFLRDALQGFREIGIDPATPLNFMGQAFLMLEDYNRAEDYYQQALASSIEKGTKSEEAKAYIGLGKINLETQNLSRAIGYLNDALNLADKTELLREKSEAYKGLSEAYARRNDYRNAFLAQQRFAQVEDSIKSEKYANEMSQLRTVFDLEQKEKEIALLNAENDLNELQIEEDARQRQLLLIILGLFLAIIAGFVFQFFYIRRTNRRLAFERNRSDQILLNILPRETADELKEQGFVKARELEQITVLFTDFKAFSLIAERISADKLVKSVDYYFKSFDEITERHGLEKIKTIGDAYMCAGGLPTPNQTHVRDAFKAAVEILNFVRETEMNPPPGIYPFKIRIGLNSGPVVAGVVGTKKFAYDIWGNTVNIAARMESGSVPGRINVSESIYQELKDEYDFTYRGELEVKNQVFKMYFAEVPEVVPA